MIPDGTKFNKGIYECIECGFEAAHLNVTPYILTISDSKWGEMVVWECPKCFQKQMFHNRRRLYDYRRSLASFKGGDHLTKWIVEGLPKPEDNEEIREDHAD